MNVRHKSVTVTQFLSFHWDSLTFSLLLPLSPFSIPSSRWVQVRARASMSMWHGQGGWTLPWVMLSTWLHSGKDASETYLSCSKYFGISVNLSPPHPPTAWHLLQSRYTHIDYCRRFIKATHTLQMGEHVSLPSRPPYITVSETVRLTVFFIFFLLNCSVGCNGFPRSHWRVSYKTFLMQEKILT